jgi:hypothetical protein
MNRGELGPGQGASLAACETSDGGGQGSATTVSDMRRERLPLPALLAALVAIWAGLFIQRAYTHAPNFDDYLYAITSAHIADALVAGPVAVAKAISTTGIVAPLVPALATVGTHTAGVQGAVAVEVVLLVLLAAGAYKISRLWLAERSSASIAGAVVLNQAVLSWSVMLNFALATAAFTTWAFLAYLRSDRLRKWQWAIATGVAVGLLLISRSIAPAYVAPFLAVIAVDIGWHHRHALRTIAWAQIVSSAVVAAVIALPWWAVSGPVIWHYLSTAGYGTSSGFAAGGGIRLSPGALIERIGNTLADLGYVQGGALVAAVVAACVMAVRGRRTGAAVIVAWTVVALVILTTSGNAGSGFGLPVLVMSIIAGGVVLARQLPAKPLLATIALLLIFGVAAEGFGNGSLWWLGPHYRADAQAATGDPRTPNLDELNQSVLSVIGGQPTVLARDDDVVNANGLSWFAARGRIPIMLLLPEYGPAALTTAEEELAGARYVILGETDGQFHIGLSLEALRIAAVQRGFHLVYFWRVSAHNTVQVWEHA